LLEPTLPKLLKGGRWLSVRHFQAELQAAHEKFFVQIIWIYDMGGKRAGKASTMQGPAPVLNDASTEEKGDKTRHTCLHSQLHKTKFCMYHLKGACQFGSTCSFAHSCAELQATPDLRRTRLCIDFFEGRGCTDPDCGFAHCEEDLRSTDMFYKKTLCIWNEKRKCRNGDQCRFAHGLPELRANQGQEPGAPIQDELEMTKTVDRIGRQTSEVSGTTTASCGNLSSLNGASSADGSSVSNSTRSRPGRRGKKAPAGAAGAEQHGWGGSYTGQMSGPDPSGPNTVAMPMKILPARDLGRDLLEQALLQRPIAPGPPMGMPMGPPMANSQDPALQAELHRLRCSVNALAQTCNHLNDQICMETIRGGTPTQMSGAHLSGLQQARQLLNHAAQGVMAKQLLSQVGASNIPTSGRGQGYPQTPIVNQDGVDWRLLPGRFC